MLRIFDVAGFSGMSPPFPHVDPPSAEAIDRYLLGEGTADERKRVLRWIEAHPDGHAGMALLREVRTESAPPAWNPEAQWNNLLRQLVTTQLTQEPAPATPIRPQPRGRFQRSIISAAAVCATLAAIIIGVREYRGDHPAHATTQPAAYTISTRSAQRTEITLADGTQVFLNVASRLEVPSDFGVHQRKVILHGQAVFRVAHATSRPFSVRAAGTDINVLGTEFGVRAYDAADPLSVAVRSGRVSVGSAVLQAGDIGHAFPGNAVRIMHQQNLDVAFDFTDGRMTFNKARLRDIIPDLNRWYDVEIRLGSMQLEDRQVSGALKSGGTESLVEALQEAFNLRVERHGRVVTLYETR